MTTARSDRAGTAGLSSTANWIAAVRARETSRTDRLFADPYAAELAGDAGFRAMQASERATGGENTFIPIRVRWFDDAVRAGVADGVAQVVLLGAGLDTRPYRLDLPETLNWFELDRANVFTQKLRVLADTRPNCHISRVEVELSEDWTTPLLQAGFTPDRSTLWLAEGLFFYLTEESIHQVLGSAAANCPGGSRFLADVMGTAGLTSEVMRPYRDWCARTGTPPPFGHDNPAELFAAGGWTAERLVTPGGPDANYGRVPRQPAGPRPGLPHLVAGMRAAPASLAPAPSMAVPASPKPSSQPSAVPDSPEPASPAASPMPPSPGPPLPRAHAATADTDP
jgi:methyltransferase (TIGR00027 family)